MEKTNETTSLLKKGIRFLLKCLPFLMVIALILFVVMPLGKKIKETQAMVKQQRINEVAEQKPLTNVVTMEMIPGRIIEKISLPGVAKPWISLQVVSEERGKIVEKKVTEGLTVSEGDLLAVIDKSDYQNHYDSALASYETALTAEERLKALFKNKFATQSQVDEAIARVKTTKAALDNAELSLSRCTIRSPMRGIVNKVFIENGQFMGAGDPVVNILQIDRVKVEVGIPESDVDAVRRLTHFDMTIDALGDKPYQGTHYYLSKTTGNLARLYTLQIAVDNTDQQIFPDMFARVKIVKRQIEDGLAVPMYAIITKENVTGVFVAEQGIARFKPVETGILDGWRIEIPKGLEPGEKVVVVGHRIIEDGEEINVLKSIQDMEELSR